MKTYTIKEFKSIISDFAENTSSDQVLALMAHRKAFQEAGRWTNGRYEVPSEEAFKAAIIQEKIEKGVTK